MRPCEISNALSMERIKRLLCESSIMGIGLSIPRYFYTLRTFQTLWCVREFPSACNSARFLVYDLHQKQIVRRFTELVAM